MNARLSSPPPRSEQSVLVTQRRELAGAALLGRFSPRINHRRVARADAASRAMARQLIAVPLMMGRLVLVVAFLAAALGGVAANVIRQDSANTQDDEQGLYNASDLVAVLNVTNMKETVRGSDRAWLVEFYNSWCGFCKRFAPIWKSFAKSVHGWSSIVTIAAIDCANDDNNPLCRDFEIMRYPTLKFFPVNANQDSLGLEIGKDSDETLIMQSLIDQLEKEQQEQRSGPNWPNIVPYRGTELEALWHGAPSNIKYEILIFEEPNSYLGAPVILDLHKIKDVRIRRVTKENEFLCVTTKVTKFPSVVVLNRDNTQTNLKVDISTREGIRNVIEEFLRSKGISVDIKDDKDELIHGRKLTVNHKLSSTPNDSEDKLYQLDLETTLRYSLNNEIPLSPRISDEKLKALKEYLKVLSEYFPIHMPKGKMYLQLLKEIVGFKSNITGREFKEHVKVNEKGLAPVYSGPKTWIACKGSSPTLRGYPCGLWTMFHTLTVAAAEDFIDDNHSSVLAAMHGYIKNFFGCADCAMHFEEMAKKRKLFDVRGGDEAILWLWRAHNEVNERLAGDDTEDPEHKKIQYPADKHCPQCKLPDGKWDETEILKYLKYKYSKPNIDLSGISDKLLQHEIDTSVSNSSASYRKIGWDFTIFDISICVVLYVTSAAILILVCIKFAYKRTSKKKVSLQHLFGIA